MGEENPIPPFKKAAVVAAVDVIAGNEDVLSLILLKLPVKSLVRFKLVSKQWLDLICSPRFTRAHIKSRIQTDSISLVSVSGLYLYYSLANNNSSQISGLSLSNGSLPSLSFLEEFSAKQGYDFKVLQSCNGILLCIVTCKCAGIDLKIIIVYNPATRNGNVLPLPYEDPFDMELVIGFGLIFDPVVSHHYKVVCVKKLKAMTRASEISIYTSENDSWRKSSCQFHHPWFMCFDRVFFWNGGIHWIGDSESLHFDVGSEKMTIRDMPPKPQGYAVHKRRYVGECSGHLHFIQVKSQSAVKFNVLELDKATFKWFVKYRVHLARIISAFPEVVRKIERDDGSIDEVRYEFNILAVSRVHKEEESALILAIPGKVISYNFARKTVKLLFEVTGKAEENFRFECITAYPYSETLATIREYAVLGK